MCFSVQGSFYLHKPTYTMQIPTAFNTHNLTVFSQVAKESFYSQQKKVKTARTPLQLVKSANTHILCKSQSLEEASTISATFDITYLGYFSADDYDLKIEFSPSEKIHKAMVSPISVYPLLEDLNLPVPPDYRSKLHLSFFSDEFERMKIRAEKVLSGEFTETKIRLFATRNLQITRKLFHDTSILFRTQATASVNETNNSDVYIIYILNLFVIRAMVFYTKFFKPYIGEQPLSEESMREQLHHQLPTAMKYPWLFDQRPPLNKTLNSFVFNSIANAPPETYAVKGASMQKDIPEFDPKLIQTLQQLKGKFKINCNTNILLDVFYQFLKTKNPDGSPYLECEIANLVTLLSEFFTDKDDVALNPSSIRTVLKPSNFKKRPHPDDPKRIDVSKSSNNIE